MKSRPILFARWINAGNPSVKNRLRNRDHTATSKALVLGVAMAAIPTHVAQAGSQTWDGDTDADWTNANNWVGNAGSAGVVSPGAEFLSADTATFSAALNGAIGSLAAPVLNDAGRNVRSVLFDTANAGAYVIGTVGGNQLQLSHNGNVTVSSSVVNAQVINAPILIRLPSSTNGAYSFTNNATATNASLTLNNVLSGSAGTRPLTITLGGSNTGENTIGSFTDQGTAGALHIVKSGTGTWVVSGASTISSQTDVGVTSGWTINGGTLAAANNAAMGTHGTANTLGVAINNTGTLEIRNGITLDNGLSLNLNNGGTIKGVGTAATNGRINVGTAAGTSVTVSAVGASDVFTIGNGSNDFTGGASDSVVHVSGAGTVVQSVASNYAGTWSVDSGTLRLGSGTALGTQSSTINIASGGKLQLNAQNWTFTNLTGSGTIENGHASTNVTLTLNKSSASTFAGVLQNGGAATLGLTKSGFSTLTLTGQNTYTGATTVSGGSTLKLDFTAAGAPTTNIISSSSALSLGAATLQVAGASASSVQTVNGLTMTSGLSSISVSNSATLNMGAIATVPFGATLRFSGLGTIGASGNVAATGSITTTTVGNGPVGALGTYQSQGQVGGYATVGLYDWASTSLADGTAGTSPYSIIGGSQVTGFYTTSTPGSGSNTNWDYTTNNVTLGSGNIQTRTVRFNSATALTLNMNGSGTNFLNNAFLVTPNVGANNVAINGNSWQVLRQTNPNGGQEGIIWQNNTLGFLNFNGNIVDGRDGTVDPNTIVKAGAGTLMLGGANSYTGQTYVNEGSVLITNNANLGAIATGASLNLNNGSLLGNATFTLDNAGANKRAVNLNGIGGGLSASTGNTLTVSGVVAGSGNLSIGSGTLAGTGAGTANTTAIVGDGTVSVGGANTFTGNIDVNAGILAASLQSNSTNPTTGSLGNTQTAGRSINVNNGGTLRFDNGDVMGGASSTIQTGLVVAAGGTVTNNGTSFNTLGAVTLNGGTLTGTGGSSNGQFQMYAFGGTVAAGGSSASIISGAGTTGGGTAASTVGYHLGTGVSTGTTFNVADATGSNASDLNVSAALIDRTGGLGTAFLTKTGAGTMTLSGANTYTGLTTISAGTLVINGDQTNSTGNVSVTGTLAGSGGIVGGNTTVNTGGKLAVGNGSAGSVGTETFKENLTLSSGSIFDWDLTSTSESSGFDKVAGASGKTFDATGATFRVITDLAFTDTFWDTARTWNTIFSGFTTLTGWSPDTAVAVYGTNGSLRNDVSVEGSFTVTGGTLGWNFAAVPEPTSALAGLLIGAGLLRRRRA